MKNDILIKVLSLAFFAKSNGLKIAVAESCTSGLLASLLSSLAGSSTWFDFGVVCYSDLSKKRDPIVKSYFFSTASLNIFFTSETVC